MSSGKDCVHNIRDCHHELLSLVDPSIIAHSLDTRQHRACTLLTLDTLNESSDYSCLQIERWLGHTVLIMIGVGYRNVAVNVYVHKNLSNTHGSSYVDRANFGYVIARHVNMPFSFLGLQKVVKMTWTGCWSRKLDCFKIQIARNVTVRYTARDFLLWNPKLFPHQLTQWTFHS